jgi:RNA polymerase subunit RPABC4/transcription elongation factor Spt4
LPNLENCPTCKNPTSVNAETCPKCGEPLGADWAVPIRKSRAIEIEAEESALKQRAVTQRKKDRNKRIFWIVLIGVPFIWYLATTDYSGSKQKQLEGNHPAKIQKQVQKLEQKVAKVPASNIDENIRLYKALNRLDPENSRYAKKIARYEGEKKKLETAKDEVEKTKNRADELAKSQIEKYYREKQAADLKAAQIRSQVTTLSTKANALKMKMVKHEVIRILGAPTWAITPEDTGEWALPPEFSFELMWRNGVCNPVVASFEGSELNGWSEGRGACQQETYKWVPGDDFLCSQSDRASFCQ